MMNLTSKEPYESAYSKHTAIQAGRWPCLVQMAVPCYTYLLVIWILKNTLRGVKKSEQPTNFCMPVAPIDGKCKRDGYASLNKRARKYANTAACHKGAPKKLAALQNTNKPYRAEPISRSRRTSAHKCYLLPSNRRVTYASVISQPHDLGNIHEIRFISHSSAISEQWRSSGDNGRPNSIRKWTAAENIRQDAPGGHNHPTRLHLLLCIRIIIL